MLIRIGKYPMTLSVCLIVKDEEEVLDRCLTCVKKFADEIIIVDTGSTDNSVEIAKKFTDKVYFFKWCGDFSAARNFAFDKASCSLLMWLDADDVIEDASCQEINRIKNNFDGYDMAFLPYAVAFDGEIPTFVYNRERIFRSDKGYRFSGEVHEAVAPYGKILYSNAVIYHKKVKENEPLRNLNILQKKIAAGKDLDERQKFYYGRELYYNNMYRQAIAVLEDFLRGAGWVVNKVEACIDLFNAYIALGDKKGALNSLLHSFTLSPPNSQICCILGEYFLEKGELHNSEYWYKAALNADNSEKEGGFVNADYCKFVPYMQLCVIYDRLGNVKKAYECNAEAGRIKPHNENYLNNVKYFEKLGLRGNIND